MKRNRKWTRVQFSK